MTATAPDSPQLTEPSDARTRRLMYYTLGVVGLYLLTLCAYIPAFHASFIWDDDYYVTNDPALRTFDGLQRIWIDIRHPREYPVPQYYPMTLTTFWIEHHFFGQTPLGYHVINILLHATSAWVLWVILRKLKLPGAWVIAAVWAVHPLQVESVAWITERKNVLSALLALLALLVYLRFAGLDVAPQRGAEDEEPTFGLPTERWKVYLLATTLFIFALLSKSVVGALPAVILLIIWWKRGRWSLTGDVLPLVPWFVLAGAMGWVTGWMEHYVVGARGAEWDFTFPQRLLIAGHAVWFYVGKTLMPLRQAFFYDRWNMSAAPAWWWIYPIGVVALTVVLWATRRRLGRGPLVAWLIYLALLFPALGFVSFFPMRYSFVADHFQYHAEVALVALIAVAVATYVRPREAAVTVAVLVIAMCVVLSAVRARVFENQLTLWTDTIQKTPQSWAAHTNLGMFLLGQYDLSGDDSLLGRAAEELHAGRRISDHRDPLATVGLGLIDERRGNIARAKAYYTTAIQEYDDLYRGTNVLPLNAALPRFNLGALLAREGKVDEAIREYEAALALNPRFIGALENLADAYRLQGRTDDAINTANRVLDIDPESTKAHNTLAAALAEQGRLQEALNQWLIVLRQDPRNYVATNNIGLVLLSMGRLDDAEQEFKKALEIKPDFATAQQNLKSLERRRQEATTRPAATQFVLPPTTAPVMAPTTAPTTAPGARRL